ncbi:MAG: M16 family metallopeptidase [Alphaproteobacteria bacterium]
MKLLSSKIFSAILLLILASCGQQDDAASGLHVDVDYYRLDNGLRVVLAPEPSVPTITVAVYYNVGFGIEPQERTGFAHLFEPLMFEGTPNMPEGEFAKFINGGGGAYNGSTRFDFTNYFEVMPTHQLEPVLWVEADRMKEINFLEETLENQKGVVSNEVKVNVLNRPYGGFPWLDLPQVANTNWQNAHNFYGDLADLEAATLEDVRSFFYTYYRPNNAVLVVAGDFDVTEARGWIEKYFAAIPMGDPVPEVDISEPRQTAEKFATREDPFAPQPALAFGYQMPDRGTPEYYAMGLLDLILLQGEDSRLYQKLVKEKGISSSVFGGINMLGNMYNYSGPMLWAAGLIHSPEHSPEDIVAAVDEVIDEVKVNGVTQEEVDRALRKLRSGLYDTIGSTTRIGLVDLLASFALFDDDPSRINNLESEFDQVTPELIKATAVEYLRATNRTVLLRVPAQAEEGE